MPFCIVFQLTPDRLHFAFGCAGAALIMPPWAGQPPGSGRLAIAAGGLAVGR
jgi:hypothetical protein